MGRSRKAPQGAFLLVKYVMISKIKYSGLFPEPHASPVGSAQGLNQPKPQPPAVPVVLQPVKS